MNKYLIFAALIFLYSCPALAQDMTADSLPVNLGKNVNSRHPELAPMISPDGQTLYFSRDHYQKEIEKTSRKSYHMVMVEYQTIYSSQLDTSGSWKPARKMKEEMNSSEFNALCSIAPDGNSILLYKFPRLYISRKNGNSWGNMVEQKIDNFYDSSNFCNFYLSNDGRYLISSVTRQQKRKEDIFVSFLLGPNHWSVPRNLGPAINSFGREISPFLSADNRTLYFSSDSWGGLGEMDIYVSHRHDSSWTDWSPARNLGTPVNTSGWDAYFSIPASGDYAYYVSTQSGFGEEDIFKVKLPEWAKPHPLVVVKGKVVDKETGKPLKAEIIIEQEEGEEEAINLHSNSLTGEFEVVLHPNEKYIITLQVSNYLMEQYTQKVSSDTLIQYEMLEMKMYGCKLLKHVYFKSGKCDISPEDSIELTHLARLLSDNLEMNLEVVGYTDATGKKRYNKKLSLMRAEAVKKFLISKGVAADRITAIAKGQESPLLPNDTEEGKRINRRVELKVTQGEK